MKKTRNWGTTLVILLIVFLILGITAIVCFLSNINAPNTSEPFHSSWLIWVWFFIDVVASFFIGGFVFKIRQNTLKITMIFLGVYNYIIFFGFMYGIFGLYSTFQPSSNPLLIHDIPICLYFSVVTLTTVGYGDYIPANGICRFIAAFEALSGYFLMAILIAALIKTMSGSTPTQKSRRQPSEPD